MASNREGKGKQGFASMDAEKARMIQSMGGRASHGGGRTSNGASRSEEQNEMHGDSRDMQSQPRGKSGAR
jgi:hypothetical protein